MRITALYDQNGVIIAAAVSTGRYDDPVPVASGDNKVDTFDVPASHAQRPLGEICTSLRIDTDTKRFVEA